MTYVSILIECLHITPLEFTRRKVYDLNFIDFIFYTPNEFTMSRISFHVILPILLGFELGDEAMRKPVL